MITRRIPFIFLFLIVGALVVNAKTYTLPSEVRENGDIVVYNSSNMGKVKDKLHIENNTDTTIKITIYGEDNTGAIIQLASESIKPRDMLFARTKYEDKLKNFRKFIINIENGKILNHIAEVAWSDLYFYVNETDLSINSTSFVDELTKWKMLLDEGIITKDEFDAKKKQLLGL